MSSASTKPRKCKECGSTEFATDHIQTSNDVACARCGLVVEESPIVAELTWAENAAGAATLTGQNIRLDQSSGSSSLRSRDITIHNAKRKISALASALHIPSFIADSAAKWYNLALTQNFVKGRKSQNVIAACLYVACRKEKTHHMLLDFSSKLQLNVYSIGSTFLKMVKQLNITSLPLADPSLFIQHFADNLNFGSKKIKVLKDAVKLAQRMSNDWIYEGRRPAGIAGACVLIAARMNHFRRTHVEISALSHVGASTLQERMNEFKKSNAGSMSINEFRNTENTEIKSSLPPAYMNNIRRKIEDTRQGMSADKDFEVIHKFLDTDISSNDINDAIQKLCQKTIAGELDDQESKSENSESSESSAKSVKSTKSTKSVKSAKNAKTSKLRKTAKISKISKGAKTATSVTKDKSESLLKKNDNDVPKQKRPVYTIEILVKKEDEEDHIDTLIDEHAAFKMKKQNEKDESSNRALRRSKREKRLKRGESTDDGGSKRVTKKRKQSKTLFEPNTDDEDENRNNKKLKELKEDKEKQKKKVKKNKHKKKKDLEEKNATFEMDMDAAHAILHEAEIALNNDDEQLKMIEMNRPKNLVANLPTTEDVLKEIPDKDTFSDLDDTELDGCLLTEEESAIKERVFINLNGDYILESEQKRLKAEADELTGNKAPIRRRRTRPKLETNGLGVGAEIAAEDEASLGAVSGAISSITGVGKNEFAANAHESMKNMLRSRQTSAKLNYKAIDNLFYQ